MPGIKEDEGLTGHGLGQLHHLVCWQIDDRGYDNVRLRKHAHRGCRVFPLLQRLAQQAQLSSSSPRRRSAIPHGEFRSRE